MAGVEPEALERSDGHNGNDTCCLLIACLLDVGCWLNMRGGV